MTLSRIGVWLLLAGAVACGRAEETNFWPLKVTETGTADDWTAAGPFLFSEPTAQGGRIFGFRPFYVEWDSIPHFGGALEPGIPLIPESNLPPGQKPALEEYTVLYPLFHYRDYGSTYSWSIFELIDDYGRKAGTGPFVAQGEATTFDIWPLYFSRHSPNASENYHALLPIGGHIQDKLGFAQVSFILFPLYVQYEREGAVTTEVPFPILRFTHGAEQGFELWPLFGHRERPGEWDRHYALWPLIWKSTARAEPAFSFASLAASAPAAPSEGVTRDLAVLPFYASAESPALTDRDYLWPFFGYTDRRAPYRYHETRYFWPFFVQGRGENHYHNRWGPFYTHSVVLGVDKTWVLFPAYRRAVWQTGNIAESRTQLLYFLYWRQNEWKASDPRAAPAYKVHYWPLLSAWDNGAGSRQWQALSPLEVFFPDNREMRRTWSPFFALCTHDEEPGGAVRTSLLWNAITWQSNRALGTSEFHLGPLFSMRRDASGRRSWRMFTLAFPRARHNLARTADR